MTIQKEFSGKVVVITGGSSGIGEGLAKAFDRHGAKLAIFGRDQRKLDKVKSGLSDAIAVQGDIRKLTDIERLFQKTAEAFGKVDVLIANAGIGGRRIIDDVDEAFFDEVVNTNYKGVYFTVQRSLPYLKKGASVLIISSAASHIAVRNHSVYSSTKAAISMLASCLSADLIPRGIRVNAISPGYTDTPIFDTVKANNPNQMQEYAKGIPIGRIADTAEIAEAALFLASPRGSYVVGADLVIDGGLSSIHASG